MNGVTTSYVYDIGGSLPLVVQDGTNTLVYGLDLISSTDGGGNQTYFSYDGLGSTTDLTDGTGAVTDTYSYDIFGAVRARTGTNASPWKFTGEQEDGAAGDSGYYFLRARYLDTATGRFISRDPLPFDQRYAYAGANPVLNVDPDGKCWGQFRRFCPPEILAMIGGVDRALNDAVHEAREAEKNEARAACGGQGTGYVDVGGGAVARRGIGPQVGAQADCASLDLHLYAGVQVGTGGALQVAPGQSVSTGLNCGAGIGYKACSAQGGWALNGGWFWETGAGTPGFSASCAWVFPS